jgi:hypothetical protein
MTEIDPIMSPTCPLWGTLSEKVFSSGVFIVNSPRAGGHYRIDRSALNDADSDLKLGLNAKLTTWLVEQRLNGVFEPVITSEIVEAIRQRKCLSYSEKIEKFFRYIAERNPYIGEALVIRGGAEQKTSDKLAAYIEARQGPEISPEQVDEVAKFIGVIAEAGYISTRQPSSDIFVIKIEPKGWEYLDELSKKKKVGDKAFVAMWFDRSLNKVYNTHIETALIECGYSSPFRIDQQEHSDKIDDAIIAKINDASLVIVDLTCEIFDHPNPTEGKTKIVEARGGVYFEAGYAMGLGIQIIWTCRKDCVEHIHFDLRQYSQIVWHEEEGTYNVKGLNGTIPFKEALINRISALRLNRNER